ncbi:glycosyl transferase family 2 [Chitinophaga dinghuensis]|uniref:dolichyl-phosphate beta-glucosyltransferase n=1 Tax=Chitinophaga dinghuensis TaxID=1539050 RepID=A0A327VTP9_9BACT|nr:response regulator [Chitinophaga dinghuensis]RAJ77409.1 glycosyl transferase family 2 [Chitinophaga dinghuensis]
MKILIADDQSFIRHAVVTELKQQGHDVLSANNGTEAVSLYNTEQPHLVMVDYNMPGQNGLEVLEYIRQVKQDNIPVIVMSSNEDEDTIVRAFEAGADDYIEKPVGIRELLARIHRLLQRIYGDKHDSSQEKNPHGRRLQKKSIAVVIPCYNEEKRLSTAEFTSFSDSNYGIHLCFVNDGSKDNTLEILHGLSEGREDFISVFNMEQNGGKAEAVRQGILHMASKGEFDYIGYLDADLSTDFNDLNDLVNTITTNGYKIVSGSRISRVGANITKNGAREIISKVINLIIRNILGMSFQDTQCGAKVMATEIIPYTFHEKFITRWLFDVEIFMRIKKQYGKDMVSSLIYEQPLKRWIHADGSKLSMKDSLKIVGQLARIAVHYRNYQPVQTPAL